MTSAAEPRGAAPILREEPKSGAGTRLVAGLGGLAVLACTAIVSLGTVLIVLIGMAVVAGVQRKRGRALTRSGHWVAACATMAVVLLALSGALFASVPRGAMDAAKRSMDSSSIVAAKQPPPAWVQRLYPQYAQQVAANRKPPSPAMVWASMLIGVGIVVAFFGTLLGTLSWGAGMLLGLAALGRWPGVQGESFENLAVDLRAPVSAA